MANKLIKVDDQGNVIPIGAEFQILKENEVYVANNLLTIGPPNVTNRTIAAQGTAGNNSPVTYTATEDCYVQSSGNIFLSSTASGDYAYRTLLINGTIIVWEELCFYPQNFLSGFSTIVPLLKGQTITYSIRTNGTTQWNGADPTIYKFPPVISPPVYLESAPLIDYSTVEQDTGRKWIDGRNIYQKTISWTGAVNATSNLNIGTITSLLPGISEIVQCVTRDMGRSGTTSSSIELYLDGSTGQVKVENVTTISKSSRLYYFTVDYVK